MPLLEPHSKPLVSLDEPVNVSDPGLTFSCIITISAKEFYKKCKLSKDQKLSGQFGNLDVLLSNSEIRISSLVNFSSDQIKVLVPTEEPISFRVFHKCLRSGLDLLTAGKKYRRIALAYKADENLLVILSGTSEVFIQTNI
ncbi:hypothetical protein MKW94_015509 [Papaver nudicaule]|uniref:Uncharacterized protein n=1 Tax=Papaver nudicaule TaxID=74823 RepID=A0AA41SD25_PAPNU|nr:hypothetical protein [Papaver nudicaule]